MEQMLWDAAALTQAQSWDWDAYYNRAGVGTTGAYKNKTMPKFPLANVAHWDMYDHGVNNAMGTKSCSTWYRQDKNESAVDAAYHKLHMQDMWQGQPHGMFSADECFGGRALNRGVSTPLIAAPRMLCVPSNRCTPHALRAAPPALSASR